SLNACPPTAELASTSHLSCRSLSDGGTLQQCQSSSDLACWFWRLPETNFSASVRFGRFNDISPVENSPWQPWARVSPANELFSRFRSIVNWLRCMKSTAALSENDCNYTRKK